MESENVPNEDSGPAKNFNNEPNPMDHVNWYSYTAWSWLNDLLKRGYKRPLESEDFYGLSQQDDAKYLGEELGKLWEVELQKSKATPSYQPSLVRVYMRFFSTTYLICGLWGMLESGAKVAQAVLMGYLVQYFADLMTDHPPPSRDGYLYSMGLVLLSFALNAIHHFYFFYAMRGALQMRIGAVALVYRKALKLSHAAFLHTTAGQIANLISSDVARFDKLGVYGHFLWLGPFEFGLAMFFLWQQVGVSSMTGLALIISLIPFQAILGKKFGELRTAAAAVTDERVKLMNEVISGMRVMKMFAWEPAYVDRVTSVRSLEVDQIRKACYMRGFNMASYMYATTIIGFVTFITYFFLGNELTSRKVFVTLSLFNSARLGMTLFLPFAIEGISEVRVTLDRLKRFLLLPEYEVPLALPSASPAAALSAREQVSSEAASLAEGQKEGKQATSLDWAIKLEHYSASWDNDMANKPTLVDLNIEIPKGQLVAIVGPVGAGKSSVLLSLLGELTPATGTVGSNGTMAYASQQPWIMSGNVEGNILLGRPYDEGRMKMVVEACSLHRDLEQWPNGLKTEIGERGITLSGGQRARVSLARALYCDSDVYLLDDPLSAVDPGVAKHLFQRCFRGALAGKTVVLVTHQVQFLEGCDRIILLDRGGKVAVQGTFPQVSAHESFSRLLATLGSAEDETPSEDVVAAKPAEKKKEEEKKADDGTALKMGDKDGVKLRKKEERGEGSISLQLYWQYFQACGGLPVVIFLIFIAFAAQVVTIMCDWWLAHWVTMSYDNKQRNVNVYIFAGLVGGCIIAALMRCEFYFKYLLESSKNLHNSMLARVVRAPIAFFDSNPIGRILNRFSNDIGLMDDMLPQVMTDFTIALCMVIGSVLLVCIINPWVFIPMVPMTVSFYYMREYFLRSSREVKRLEAISRSPVHSHVSMTLDGLHSIRSFRIEPLFINSFIDKQNANTRAYFAFLTISRWLGYRLDFLSALFILFTAFFAVAVGSKMDPGLVGLSLTYSLQMLGLFQWCVRQSSEVENQMTSVERVIGYTHLAQEAPLTIPEKKPADPWPSRGQIEFKDMSLTYIKDAPPVLKNVTFTVQPQEKIGVVGRTGSGKTTLMMSLFRMAEFDGSIVIDDVPVETIGLHDLRGKLSIIPQEPVLFSGTVRKNLDPFNEATDDRLWSALREVQMDTAIETMGGLTAAISESGQNLSVGQRQLMCLARAITRHAKILVMDEATANVDLKTDGIIQTTIRERFASCTVLVIAHRLNTIIDCDRVLVLDHGRLLEYDAPFVLLNNPQGAFASMATEAGPAMCSELYKQAKAKYESVHGPAAVERIEHTVQNTMRMLSPPAAAGVAEEQEAAASSRLLRIHI